MNPDNPGHSAACRTSQTPAGRPNAFSVGWSIARSLRRIASRRLWSLPSSSYPIQTQPPLPPITALLLLSHQPHNYYTPHQPPDHTPHTALQLSANHTKHLRRSPTWASTSATTTETSLYMLAEYLYQRLLALVLPLSDVSIMAES